MGELATVNSFIARSRTVRDTRALKALTADVARELGFDYFSLIQFDFARGHDQRAQISISNYPEAWVEHVTTQRYFSDDPAYLAAGRTNAGFRLSEIPSLIKLSRRHRKIMSEARRAGLGDGFTVPAHVPGESNGIATFIVSASRSLPESALPLAQVVGAFSYEAARRLRMQQGTLTPGRVPLTPRQLDCIILVAHGKTDWEIGQILGIQEETVTEYLDEARRRYDVARRTQLVVHALYDGHFSISALLA